MRRIIKRRPSPAMIIAVIALIAALTGTAFAGGFLTKKKFQNQAVRTPITYSTSQFTIPVTPANGAGTDVSAPCPFGSTVLGGGIKVSNDVVEFVNDSHPTVAGWAGTVFNAGTVNHSAQVTAICAIAAVTTGTRPGS
jgi:hypothetical protein